MPLSKLDGVVSGLAENLGERDFLDWQAHLLDGGNL